MRKFYFRYVGEAFVLYRERWSNDITPKIEVKTEILPLHKLNKQVVKKVTGLQGGLSFLYLRFIYGSPETYLALAWEGEQLVHIGWITPSKKCRKRFPFIPEKAYMIGPCQTAPLYRGNRIYPFVLQQISRSLRGFNEYWICTNEKNIASIRGIEKAGAKKVGRFVQKRWFWGRLTSIKYYPDKP